jgi:hypothetical protein
MDGTIEARYIGYIKNWLDHRHYLGVEPMMSFYEYRLRDAIRTGVKCKCGKPITLRGSMGTEFRCFRCSGLS